MSGDILTCLGHTDWHYFEPCQPSISLTLNNIHVVYCRPVVEPARVPMLPLSIAHASDVLDMPVDPNEPTYCICRQVSYGEMIGCDNPDVSFTVLSSVYSPVYLSREMVPLKKLQKMVINGFVQVW